MIQAPRSVKPEEEVPLPPALGPVWGLSLSFPEVPGKFALRELLIAVAAAEGGGTALRADAQVRPVPAREHIPSGVRRVRVKARDARHHVHFKRIVRDRATVRRIVGLVEQLKLAPPLTGNMRSCPGTEGAAVVALSFRGAARRRPLAHLKIDENGCSIMKLRIHGHGTRDLQGAFETVGNLELLLEHRL